MPFLGTTPTQGFVSSVNKQSFAPDGILTSFTLNHPVANANDLEVFVGNVRQEPTAAYTAAGTTLDFGTGNAPPNGVNFYVIYKNQAQVTTTPTDNSITTSKILNNAVTEAKILNGAVTNTKLGVNAIGTTQIANDAITLAKANDDFYKTGTFSVLFRDGSGGSGNDSQTFSGQTYVKIGSVVHCNIFCENITTTGMGISNDMYMHGLPFAPNRTSYAHVWTSFVTMLGSNNADVSFVATNGVTYGYFSVSKGGAEAETMDTYHFGSQNNNSDIGMHLTYFTDS